MAQKPIFKSGKKAKKEAPAPKRLSARAAKTKKGAPSKPPKDAKVKELFVEEQKITKLVNARNENLHAALAVSSGAQLGVVKPPADDFVVTRKSKKTLGDLKAAIQGGALPAKKTQ